METVEYNTMEDTGLTEQEQALFDSIVSLTSGLNVVELQLLKGLSRLLLDLETRTVNRDFLTFMGCCRLTAKDMGLLSKNSFSEGSQDLATLMGKVETNGR